MKNYDFKPKVQIVFVNPQDRLFYLSNRSGVPEKARFFLGESCGNAFSTTIY